MFLTDILGDSLSPINPHLLVTPSVDSTMNLPADEVNALKSHSLPIDHIYQLENKLSTHGPLTKTFHG